MRRILIQVIILMEIIIKEMIMPYRKMEKKVIFILMNMKYFKLYLYNLSDYIINLINSVVVKLLFKESDFFEKQKNNYYIIFKLKF